MSVCFCALHSVFLLSSDNEGSERDILEELLRETRIDADVRVCWFNPVPNNAHHNQHCMYCSIV